MDIPGADGYVVLSNDQWNAARTEEVAGALVYRVSGPGRIQLGSFDAFAGELIAVPKSVLGAPLAVFGAEHLLDTEEFICDALGLRSLHESPPKAPPSQPGAVDYPMWSQIYYAGPPLGTPPQNKRRVVVSADPYNKLMKGAVCVRTTTRREPGPGFPALGDGTIAVAIAPTFFRETYVRHKPRDARPQPSQLFLPDMARVAEGLVDALDLHHLMP